MKRNISRFPEDFCFQLNSIEFKNLRCQNVTAKVAAQRRYNPNVYVKHGVAVLAGIIKSEIAAKASADILEQFNNRRFSYPQLNCQGLIIATSIFISSRILRMLKE